MSDDPSPALVNASGLLLSSLGSYLAVSFAGSLREDTFWHIMPNLSVAGAVGTLL